MLKVLILVDKAIAVSGPHRNVVSVLNALSDREDVHVRLLCKKFDSTERYAKSKRIEIISGFDPHNPQKVGSNLLQVWKASRDRDLIYVPTGLKSFLYAWVSKGSRKLVAGPNVTGIPILMDPANPSPLMTVKMSEAWIEMSELRVRQCVQAGTPKEAIYLIPHAVDTERFHPRYADPNVWLQEGMDPKNKKIIYVGRMDKEYKGIPQLVNAFLIIKERVPDVDLVLIGKPGPFLTQEHLKMKGVFFLGPRYGYDLVRLVSSSDLFMGASRYETFWLTPLEAMACGVAVVVSRVGAVPTMIPQDGVQGRVVDIIDNETGEYLPDVSERLAAAAIPLLLNDELRKKMGLEARKYVVENFSEKKLGERLMEVFKHVLERN